MTEEYYFPPYKDNPVFALNQEGTQIFEVCNSLGGDYMIFTDGTLWIKVSLEELEKYERLEE